MATATETRNTKGRNHEGRNHEQVFDETADRVRDLNEQIIEAGRKAGNAYLDAYERTLQSWADYEQKVAGATQVEWFSTVLNAQADFTREVARATTTSAREVLR